VTPLALTLGAGFDTITLTGIQGNSLNISLKYAISTLAEVPGKMKLVAWFQ
jgi:hypothetical protein